MAIINGTPGNDVLAGTSGSDSFNGLAGFDTTQVAAGSGDAVFGLDAQGRWVVTSPQGVDTLDNVEAVQFADATVTLGLGEFRVNATQALDQTQPVLTGLAGGGFLATWLTGTIVRAQRFGENGRPVGAEIASTTLGPQPYVGQHQDSVALADGGYLIASVIGDMSSYTDRYGTHPVVVPVIVVMRFGSDGAFAGAWGIAQGLRTADASYEVTNPNLEALSDGNFLVTWTASFSNSRGGSGASLVAARLDSSGVPLDGPVTLPGSPWDADVAALPGGGYALAWAGGPDVRVQHFDGTGVAASDAVRVGTGYAGSRPQLTALAEGNSVVVWIMPSGGDFDVYAQRLDSAGNPLGAAVRVNSTPVLSTAQPGVAALGDGGFVVAWTAPEQDGSGSDIRAQGFDGSGARLGGETVVNTATGGLQQQPTLTALDDGGYVIGWMSSGQGADGWDIHAQRFDASGVAVPSGHALQGDANANTLVFSGGEAVHFLGRGGDDVLQGGSGNDLFEGGAGSDTVVSADLQAAITWHVTADPMLRMTGPQAGSDALQSVEQARVEEAIVGIRFDADSALRLVHGLRRSICLAFDASCGRVARRHLGGGLGAPRQGRGPLCPTFRRERGRPRRSPANRRSERGCGRTG